MDSVIFLDAAPSVEITNGMVYLLHKKNRAVAMQPYIARLLHKRLTKALDAMDAANNEKVVAFR